MRSCRLVEDKASGKLKGTAFVDFADPAAAAAAAAACAKGRAKAGPGVTVGGRVVEVDLAVAAEDARAMAAQHAGAKGVRGVREDKRHAALAKEGELQEGSAAWDDMSEGDRKKRRRAAGKLVLLMLMLFLLLLLLRAAAAAACRGGRDTPIPSQPPHLPTHPPTHRPCRGEAAEAAQPQLCGLGHAAQRAQHPPLLDRGPAAQPLPGRSAGAGLQGAPPGQAGQDPCGGGGQGARRRPAQQGYRVCGV